MTNLSSPVANFQYRLLEPIDYDAVQNLFKARKTWMATDHSPVAGTWSLRNYWLNPAQPNWELKGAFQNGELITTHGTYWSPDIPLAFDSKLCSVEPTKFACLPSTFIHFYNEVLEDVIARGYTGFLSLVTPRLNDIYDRALVRQADLRDRFYMRAERLIPANSLTGFEFIDLHLLNLTPAPFETLIRETYLK